VPELRSSLCRAWDAEESSFHQPESRLAGVRIPDRMNRIGFDMCPSGILLILSILSTSPNPDVLGDFV
jgi:hypothetical protein